MALTGPESLGEQFAKNQAAQLEHGLKLLRLNQQLRLERDIAQVDQQIAESRLNIERQLAQARVDHAKSLADLGQATLDLYIAFHPSGTEPQAPVPGE